MVRPYERMIYATAISVVKNPADAEEVAQEAVLKAFSNLASFRSESKFSTWLVQITYKEARMKLRTARPHLYDSIDDQQQGEEGEYRPKDYADWRPISSELLEQNEVRPIFPELAPSLKEFTLAPDQRCPGYPYTSTASNCLPCFSSKCPHSDLCAGSRDRRPWASALTHAIRNHRQCLPADESQ